MEIGFFGFVLIIIILVWFNKPIRSLKNEFDEAIAERAIENKSNSKIERMKAKMGCNDPSIKTASQLLEWINNN